MTDKVYEKAKELKSDIEFISYNIRKNKKNKGLITNPTLFMTERLVSKRFQKEFVEWLEEKVKEYQKEFDELL